METVEKVQYQAALAVNGAWKDSSRSKLYEELGWEFLSGRRWRRRILQIHKILKARYKTRKSRKKSEKVGNFFSDFCTLVIDESTKLGNLGKSRKKSEIFFPTFVLWL